MKKIFFILSLITWNASLAAAADCQCSGAQKYNIFFGDTENQVGIFAGTSSGVGGNVQSILLLTYGKEKSTWENFHYFHFEYSQPTTFFRLPARQNVVAGGMLNNVDPNGTQAIFGVSQDWAFITWGRFYFGTGFGFFVQGRATPSQAGQFLFGAKSFFGLRLTDSLSVEANGVHYSNAGMEGPNSGYNFLGATAMYNF